MCDRNPTGANLSKYAQQLLQGMRLSEARTRRVLPLLTIRSFDEGTLIWARGRSVQAWSCVMTGYVAAGIPVQRGGRMPLHLFGPDAWPRTASDPSRWNWVIVRGMPWKFHDHINVL